MYAHRTYKSKKEFFCCFQLGYKLLKIHHHNWNTCANMQGNYVKSILRIEGTVWHKKREKNLTSQMHNKQLCQRSTESFDFGPKKYVCAHYSYLNRNEHFPHIKYMKCYKQKNLHTHAKLFKF